MATEGAWVTLGTSTMGLLSSADILSSLAQEQTEYEKDINRRCAELQVGLWPVEGRWEEKLAKELLQFLQNLSGPDGAQEQQD